MPATLVAFALSITITAQHARWVTGPRVTCADRAATAWRLHVPLRGPRPCTLVEQRCTGLVLWPALPHRRLSIASSRAAE